MARFGNEDEDEENRPNATASDVRDVLGPIDDEDVAAILALRPSVADLEEASIWLSGDPDIFGPGRPLKEIAGQIVALLTADDEDGPPIP
jgi:hypothetical protein